MTYSYVIQVQLHLSELESTLNWPKHNRRILSNLQAELSLVPYVNLLHPLQWLQFKLGDFPNTIRSSNGVRIIPALLCRLKSLLGFLAFWLLASHHVFTTTLDPLCMVCPSRSISGTSRGIVLRISFTAACN